jgi:signal transduction histidine kinase
MAGWHVLVVDDDDALRREIAAVLRDEGYAVTCACDGGEALDLLQARNTPDLVLLDVLMPIVNGWEFRVAQKKLLPPLASIPVLAMSASDTPQAAAIDAQSFLSKPFSLKELLDRVGEMVARIERERGRAAMLAQTDRLASVGMLAAGVAHEINNPLTYVLANIDHAREEIAAITEQTALDEDSGARLRGVRESLDDARDGAARVTSIVRDLKIFSRGGREEQTVIDVDHVLRSTVNLARPQLRSRARIVEDYGGVPGVIGEESGLGQVAVNLLFNAAHALDGRARADHEIRISTRQEDAQVIIEVHDTGEGIPRANLTKIFDPFFTTKPHGTGTGLGLSICHGIVASMGGRIEVDSTPGDGATFRVLLPVPSSDAPSAKHESVPGAATAEKRGRILIIDDEPLVLKSLRRSLAREHDVAVANTVREALEPIEAGEQFDVIVCDIMMPDRTGIDFHSAIRAIAPDLADRIIFMTGAVNTPTVRGFLEQVKNTCIEKPIDIGRLNALIRKRLP